MNIPTVHGVRSLDTYWRCKGRYYIILSSVGRDSCNYQGPLTCLTSACVNNSNATSEFVSASSEIKYTVFSCLTATLSGVRDGRSGESSTRVGEWPSFRLRQLCPPRWQQRTAGYVSRPRFVTGINRLLHCKGCNLFRTMIRILTRKSSLRALHFVRMNSVNFRLPYEKCNALCGEHFRPSIRLSVTWYRRRNSLLDFH